MKTTDLFTHRLVRGLALAVAVALLGVACGGGSTPAPAQNALPTLAFQTPLVNLEGQVGMNVEVKLLADDPDDAATINVYADRDGDFSTKGDQTMIDQITEANGSSLTVNWDTTGATEGKYSLFATIDDKVNQVRLHDCPGAVEVWNTYPHDHTNIVLKDHFGDAIQVGSDMPYSPRETCGACHDIDEIGNNFHTQQGRTNEHGQIQTKDDFFNDNRPWLISDGMYGKW